MNTPTAPDAMPSGAPAGHSHVLSSALAEALRQALAGLPARPPRMAVAVSGGADSAMLALHAAAIAREQGIDLLLFHVHHGLQDAADAWSEQTLALARLLGLPAHEARVTVAEGAGKGIEAAARDARYRALAGLAREHGAPLVLLAHHRGDQAETVLLRLLRGTGLAGMAAMAPLSRRDEVDYLRPWLDQDRDDILRACAAFEAATGWRARCRTRPIPIPITPARRCASCWRRRWTRAGPAGAASWRGMRAHGRGRVDPGRSGARGFRRAGAGPGRRQLSLRAWRELSPARQAQVLRWWLDANGARMPSEARMRDLLRQLRGLHSLGHDRQLRVEQAGHAIRCHRGRVWLERR